MGFDDDNQGGYLLSADQLASWQAQYPTEYAEYIDSNLLVINADGSGTLYDIPWWMDDGDPNNGPFDFNLNPSHGTAGT